jgi:Chaperone of endosialidase
MKIYLKKFLLSQATLIFALACFALSPQARAVCQEGCDLTNDNTFLGEDVLVNNTTGAGNTAVGFDALLDNTTGFDNTATGVGALLNNTIGSENTANGAEALLSNGSGNNNTANGANALQFNMTGSDNTAIGLEALRHNTAGKFNTGTGSGALNFNTTGNNNIALGFEAGVRLQTGSNNIYIGNSGSSPGEGAKIRIGTVGTQKATFIAGISGVTVPGGVGVIVGTDGKLGTVVSSERYKDSVRPMDKASEAILALKPVTFRYKKELDPAGMAQFGLVAEQVEKVNPDLVARDDHGKPYTVRYEAVNAMLLNEFLKEHRKVQELEATIAQLKSSVSGQQANALQQQKRIDALTAGLQKVSAQLEASKPAPQVVNNQ